MGTPITITAGDVVITATADSGGHCNRRFSISSIGF
ncbi:hypothetical protein IWX65_003601 [Arthrobacter sp. CAN_A214]